MRNSARFIALVLLCSAAHAEVAVPEWTQPVVDLTGSLTLQQTGALNYRLAALEASKGAQIAVLIVPTTRPETIFQYTMRVFDSWKPGRKGVDDGILLTVAKNDGAVFLMTGYGMEGALPDVTAKRIVMDTIIPRLARGEFYAGIDAGVSAVTDIVEREPLPPPARDRATRCTSVKPRDAVAIPPWTQPVIDLAGALDPGHNEELNRRLQAFERRKGAQIGVLIVPSTQPEDIGQFAMRVCDTWKLGRDGIDDWVILAVAKDQKQLYLTAGSGLDQALDHATLTRIASDIIGPNLMVGEFDAGIGEGLDAVMKAVNAVPLPPPDSSLQAIIGRGLSRTLQNYPGAFIFIALLGLALAYRYVRRRKERRGSLGSKPQT